MSFVDKYFFNPNFWQKILIFTLLPFSFLYALISFLNNRFRKKVDFDLPIISVGNLSVGGNGKTPVGIAISELFEDKKVFIILRGYKRSTKGALVVKIDNKIKCNVKECGDEAYEYALFSKANVIVSEKREIGINIAKKNNAQIIILDDAFSKAHIKKFDILIFSKTMPKYNFCLPSGAYRLPLFCKKYADFLAYEGKDFVKNSEFEPKNDMILISSIAKPFRLEEFKKYAKAFYFLNDHNDISFEFCEQKLKQNNAKTILCTQKDYVKIKDYGFNICLISLKTRLGDNLKQAILDYVKNYKRSKNVSLY